MDHHADVASGREQGRDARAMDEIQLRGARVLVEAERHLELADEHLGDVELLVVQVDVAPGVAVGPELGFDLVVEKVEDLALDADAPTRDVNG